MHRHFLFLLVVSVLWQGAAAGHRLPHRPFPYYLSSAFIAMPEAAGEKNEDERPRVAGVKYTRRITIDRTKVVNTVQNNFPVLISGVYDYLKTTANGGKAANANGYDIMFTEDSLGATKLNWEMERYNPSTGEIVAWVKTDVSPFADKVIYLHYGDTEITTFQGNVSGTWSNGYTAVYHLGNGSALDATDATGNNNGTVNGATAVTGKMGGGASFNGSSNHITIGTDSLAGVAGNITIQAWINPQDFSTFNGIVSKTNGNQPAPYDLYLTQGSGIPDFFRGNGTGDNSDIIASGAPSTGVWSHLAVTASGTMVTHYLNGTQNGSGNLQASGTGVNGNNNAYIGTRGDFVTRFKGSMDEVRISNVARSADWIATEYNNHSAPSAFYTLSTEISEDSSSGGGGSPDSAWALSGNAGTSGQHFLGTTDNQPLIFKTNNQEAMRILPGGEVGIGDSAARSGYKLAVKGSLLTEKVVVKSPVNWPDYVFDSSYRLPTIQEVAAYIRQHKHLPGVISASEAAHKGVLDVGDQQVMLLRKVEELTLYIIELEKRISAQEPPLRNKRLKKKKGRKAG